MLLKILSGQEREEELRALLKGHLCLHTKMFLGRRDSGWGPGMGRAGLAPGKHGLPSPLTYLVLTPAPRASVVPLGFVLSRAPVWGLMICSPRLDTVCCK